MADKFDFVNEVGLSARRSKRNFDAIIEKYSSAKTRPLSDNVLLSLSCTRCDVVRNREFLQTFSGVPLGAAKLKSTRLKDELLQIKIGNDHDEPVDPNVSCMIASRFASGKDQYRNVGDDASDAETISSHSSYEESDCDTDYEAESDDDRVAENNIERCNESSISLEDSESIGREDEEGQEVEGTDCENESDTETGNGVNRTNGNRRFRKKASGSSFVGNNDDDTYEEKSSDEDIVHEGNENESSYIEEHYIVVSDSEEDNYVNEKCKKDVLSRDRTGNKTSVDSRKRNIKKTVAKVPACNGKYMYKDNDSTSRSKQQEDFDFFDVSRDKEATEFEQKDHMVDDQQNFSARRKSLKKAKENSKSAGPSMKNVSLKKDKVKGMSKVRYTSIDSGFDSMQDRTNFSDASGKHGGCQLENKQKVSSKGNSSRKQLFSEKQTSSQDHSHSNKEKPSKKNEERVDEVAPEIDKRYNGRDNCNKGNKVTDSGRFEPVIVTPFLSTTSTAALTVRPTGDGYHSPQTSPKPKLSSRGDSQSEMVTISSPRRSSQNRSLSKSLLSKSSSSTSSLASLSETFLIASQGLEKTTCGETFRESSEATSETGKANGRDRTPQKKTNYNAFRTSVTENDMEALDVSMVSPSKKGRDDLHSEPHKRDSAKLNGEAPLNVTVTLNSPSTHILKDKLAKHPGIASFMTTDDFTFKSPQALKFKKSTNVSNSKSNPSSYKSSASQKANLNNKDFASPNSSPVKTTQSRLESSKSYFRSPNQPSSTRNIYPMDVSFSSAEDMISDDLTFALSSPKKMSRFPLSQSPVKSPSLQFSFSNKSPLKSPSLHSTFSKESPLKSLSLHSFSKESPLKSTKMSSRVSKESPLKSPTRLQFLSGDQVEWRQSTFTEPELQKREFSNPFANISITSSLRQLDLQQSPSHVSKQPQRYNSPQQHGSCIRPKKLVLPSEKNQQSPSPRFDASKWKTDESSHDAFVGRPLKRKVCDSLTSDYFTESTGSPRGDFNEETQHNLTVERMNSKSTQIRSDQSSFSVGKNFEILNNGSGRNAFMNGYVQSPQSRNQTVSERRDRNASPNRSRMWAEVQGNVFSQSMDRAQNQSRKLSSVCSEQNENVFLQKFSEHPSASHNQISQSEVQCLSCLRQMYKPPDLILTNEDIRNMFNSHDGLEPFKSMQQSDNTQLLPESVVRPTPNSDQTRVRQWLQQADNGHNSPIHFPSCPPKLSLQFQMGTNRLMNEFMKEKGQRSMTASPTRDVQAKAVTEKETLGSQTAFPKDPHINASFQIPKFPQKELFSDFPSRQGNKAASVLQGFTTCRDHGKDRTRRESERDMSFQNLSRNWFETNSKHSGMEQDYKRQSRNPSQASTEDNLVPNLPLPTSFLRENESKFFTFRKSAASVSSIANKSPKIKLPVSASQESYLEKDTFSCQSKDLKSNKLYNSDFPTNREVNKDKVSNGFRFTLPRSNDLIHSSSEKEKKKESLGKSKPSNQFGDLRFEGSEHDENSVDSTNLQSGISNYTFTSSAASNVMFPPSYIEMFSPHNPNRIDSDSTTYQYEQERNESLCVKKYAKTFRPRRNQNKSKKLSPKNKSPQKPVSHYETRSAGSYQHQTQGQNYHHQMQGQNLREMNPSKVRRTDNSPSNMSIVEGSFSSVQSSVQTMSPASELKRQNSYPAFVQSMQRRFERASTPMTKRSSTVPSLNTSVSTIYSFIDNPLSGLDPEDHTVIDSMLSCSSEDSFTTVELI